ncbi:winged helix DNA-binding protein [Novosphingobium sp. FSW06-99]|uniref:winged helix DNA-binding protein n=1 Tax=Novosphingobium sp. FSW06-99 TaxID=1739113 RepID=UPI00076C2F3D|nr:winged helix DNA-binding protein [Novosphingobium sp. FSW06-99]KUR74360.1 MarR family transcriptional regulator [Novosphingobium sp. FSW06-99]
MTVRPVGPRGSLSGRPGKVERALRAAPVSSMPTAPADAGALVRRQRLALTLAREFYAGRRRRARYLSVDLFGEPTWDILLDLYVAAREGRRVPTTSACIGAHVPPTTALRWLRILEMRALVEREDDGRDGRRTFVRLTDRGSAVMEAFLGSMAETLLVALADAGRVDDHEAALDVAAQ